MTHPHKPGRIPVVLVHGTASSPARWAELINELQNDPRFWAHYQSGCSCTTREIRSPILAMLLRGALSSSSKSWTPTERNGSQAYGRHRAQPGGLLTKMTVI